MINGRVGRQSLRAGTHTLVVHYGADQSTKEHSHPAWTVLIPRAGRISWRNGQGLIRHPEGVILPPHVAHSAGSATGHASVFIDPWFLGLGSGHRRAIALDLPTVERVRGQWFPSDTWDPDERARETVARLRRAGMLPQAVSIDPRVAAALHDLAAAERIDDVAASVRLSSSRLRALIHDQAGTPPARLRMWQRLRAAIVSLPAKPIALAACDAGFADQAHLTRTAVRLVGQTPGELVRLLSCAADRGDDDGASAWAAAA
jgi:AraC-like DNA-binding protein